MKKKYLLTIFIGVIISMVGMGIYAYATSNPTDKVIVDSQNLVAFERNFTVNGLANQQKFEINVSAEGLTSVDYLPVAMSILSNDNENEITLGRPYIDFERRDIFVLPISNSDPLSQNVTVLIILFGA